ncbi:uncharacterized protein A4U43_C09F9890 [Asparagus officinalis]|uniref:Galactose oxidase-like Early set domain-containing protein n=1 Tax=Asparagus officinalis TaxID=4686 RepID=A0A5P1E6Q0_ASPOF|nr:aldehyde oxidase GLOX-like [Asparagus officinalis]ONK58230.1 uncharacterized protein A4U43_C09F9890 [Asparagus officinalis]
MHILFIISTLLSLLRMAASTITDRGGRWDLLLNNSGVVAMHMALTHRNTVVIFDQTRSGPSGYRLNSRKSCYFNDDGDTNDNPTTCWAHSVEYDISSNTIRPLVLRSDTWCSSGAFLSSGTLLQTGGHGNGIRKIRYFRPCTDKKCSWTESKSLLEDSRWYATNQILPEKDRVFVIGGLKVFTYEFIPKSPNDEGSFNLPFLRQTRNYKEKGDNLYPFVHLSVDGHLFIFANRDSILFNYKTHKVAKEFPRMPGNGARSYPGTGSSVMLPLDYADGYNKTEIMVCGGGAPGAYQASRKHKFLEGLKSCGRIVITDDDSRWLMEEMPGPRIMSDMLILPTGDILIINGAHQGCAGWNKAKRPAYKPYLYKPNKRPSKKRFSILNSSNIARMYHSSAILLPDGRILVAGSNPYKRYTFHNVKYPTDLRMEAFSPYYLDTALDDRRPSNVSVDDEIKYGQEFGVKFELKNVRRWVKFVVYAPPFATHSLSMNQRMVSLECVGIEREESGAVTAMVVAPPSARVAPAGYYMFTVVNERVPSKSVWVKFVHG